MTLGRRSFALWVALVWLMWRDWQFNPFDPTLEGTENYGTNQPGNLSFGVVATLIELAVVLAPWSARRSVLRELSAWSLMTTWFMISVVMSMHTGGVILLHLLWVMALELWLMLHLVERLWSHHRAPS